MSVNISLIVLKKMYDILVILVDFLWKFSMILADFLLPGSGSVSLKRIRNRLT